MPLFWWLVWYKIRVMRRILFLFVFMSLVAGCSVASEINGMQKIDDFVTVQNYIDSVGYSLLTSNKIDKRMVFVYSEQDKKSYDLTDKTLSRRQILVYQNLIRHVADKNELAACLAVDVAKATLSYDGFARGLVTAVQMKSAPKKYQLLYDKLAVDLMVGAGYNPVAMITYLNKVGDQKRFAFAFTNNKTSVRLANIYEYVYTKYPQYLAKNSYLETDTYQHFLLSSENNRRKFQEKIKNNSKKRLKYE